MEYYSSRQRGSNLTSSEFKFQPKTRKLLSGIFNQWRRIHMLSCCVCLRARIISKMLTGLWCSRGVRFFVLFFASDRVAVIGTCLIPDMWQSRGAYRWNLLPPKVPGAWFGTNAHKHKCAWETGSVCMHVWICVFPPVFCLVDGGKRQVVVRAGVERAAMGISWFTMLVRKLTNQSGFSFHTDGLNGARSLIHTLQTHRLCSPVDFSCLPLSLLGSLLSS